MVRTLAVKFCEQHPSKETHVSCSKCGKAICPICMIDTPVGLRCRRCARLKRLPTYQLDGQYLSRAVSVGMVSAILTGVAVILLRNFFPLISFMGLVVLGFVGYFIGELISRGVRRRRGKILKIIAAASVFLSFIIISFGSLYLFGIVDISLYMFLGLGFAVYMAISRF